MTDEEIEERAHRLMAENAELRGRLSKYDGHQSITETKLLETVRDLKHKNAQLKAKQGSHNVEAMD